MKNANLFKQVVLPLCIAFFTSTFAFSQVLNKPEPAPNANIGATTPWTSACGSMNFNEFFVNFTWSPPLVDASNEFILELSDADGNFDTPLELDRVDNQNVVFDFDFIFNLPEDVQGDAYRFRVRSTSPAMTSPESDAFSMYFAGFTNPILISENGSGNIPSGGSLLNCSGNNITLTTHNVPDPENYVYNWFRSGTLLSETSNSITVSDDGMYFVEINYGPNCTGSGNTLSNTIEIITGSSSGIEIVTNDTAICPSQTLTLNANIDDTSILYTWFKDGVAVTTATLGDSSFTVDGSVSNFEGDYTLQIEGASICTEVTDATTITNASNFTVSLENELTVVLLPSQPTTLEASSTATTPDYQWFKDGSLISGATNSTLDITDAGVYFVRVTENGGACTGTTIDSDNIIAVFPVDFEFIIAFSGAYTACENTSVVVSLEQINAINTDGSLIDVTTDLIADFTYQWTRNNTTLSSETNNTISIASSSDNGDYALEGTLSSFNVNSNTLNVRLASNETVTITSSELAFCDGIDTITLETDIDLTSETFTWFRDGTEVSTTDAELSITETGVYELQIDRNDCPIRSNEITIIEFDESIVSVDAEENIVLVEGSSEIVTASGASSYQWFNQDNTQISNTATVTLTDEGAYLLIASVGNCTVSRNFTVSFRENFAIPNVITSNGDGVNDLWVLPNTFSKKADVTVIIYNENGEEILNEANYQNNWPESSTPLTQNKMIFYYRLFREGNVLNQGTITVIR